MNIYLIFYVNLLSLVFVAISTAKTITIPGDANSIQEAVELAASGDEIVVATDWVRWTPYFEKPDGIIERGTPEGVTIKNKDLVIRGNYGDEKTQIYLYPFYLRTTEDSTFLWIENSTVSLENLYTIQAPHTRGIGLTRAAPLHIESGALNIQNCDFVGNIECKGNLSLKKASIKGDSYYNGDSMYPYTGGTDNTPSVLIGPAIGVNVFIQDSILRSDSGIAYRNFSIKGLHKSHIVLNSSTFIGGTSDIIWGTYPAEDGSNGTTIEDCTAITMTISQCMFYGGAGYQASTHRRGYISNAGKGGSGLSIQNSILSILPLSIENKTIGGPGGSAGVLFDLDEYEYKQYPGGQGGGGITIINSHLFIENSLDKIFLPQGGNGGESSTFENLTAPPGPDGLPIYMDEFSTIETVASLQAWELY